MAWQANPVKGLARPSRLARAQDIPPKSTKAPNSAIFLTIPVRSSLTFNSERSSFFFCSRCSSISAQQVATIFRRASSIFGTPCTGWSCR